MHQAIIMLQGLDSPRYPIVDGINSLETILGKLGNPPCKKLDIRGGRVIIDWLPGIAGLGRYVLKGTNTKCSRRGSFIRHVEP
jgi:hypothetical protein